MPDGRDAWLVPAEDAGEFRLCVVAADPWSVLLDAGRITEHEAMAATRHAEVWGASMLAPAGRSGYEPAVSGERGDPADRLGDEQMAALRQWRAGQAAMPVRCRGVVYDAVAWQVFPMDVAAFRIGLRALVRFYGL